MNTRKWLREPLLHFLLAGAVLYAVAAWLDPTEDARLIVIEHEALLSTLRQRSVVTDEAALREALAVMPEDERIRLLRDTATQEALYREGKARGLDTVDSVVRLRTIQQMRLLLAEAATRDLSVSDAEVRAYYELHREVYAEPMSVGFSHVFFAGPAAEGRAKAALTILRTSPATSATIGDRFLYQLNYPRAGIDELAGQFGTAFTTALLELESGAAWQGPLRSDHGWHLVQLQVRQPAQVPAFAAIEGRIREAALDEKRALATGQAVEQLLARYTVRTR